MPADAVATLGARASAGMISIPKLEFLFPASEELRSDLITSHTTPVDLVINQSYCNNLPHYVAFYEDFANIILILRSIKIYILRILLHKSVD